MDERRVVVTGMLMCAGVGLAWLLLGSPPGPDTDGGAWEAYRSGRSGVPVPRPLDAAGPDDTSRVHEPVPQGPVASSSRDEPPIELAQWPTPTDWLAMLPAAFATEGLAVVDPWQDEQTAARVLCSGGNAVSFESLDAWAEASLWNPESRTVWWVSRRLSGQERIDAVSTFVRRHGVEDCPLLGVLEDAHQKGLEASWLPPLYGDPGVIAQRDQQVLARLRAGGSPTGLD